METTCVGAVGNLPIGGSGDGGGSVIKSIAAEAADYTIVSSDYHVLADATSNAVTITLPASPTQGQIFVISCINATFTCTIGRNGNNINGVASDLILVLDESKMLQYDATYGWKTI